MTTSPSWSAAIPRLRRARFLGISLLLLLAAAPGLAEWPQWRGPDGIGVSVEPHALPESWDPASANVRWHTAIPGDGISSPIVSRGRVFVTTAYESRRNRLLLGILRAAVLGLVLLFAVRFVGGRRQRVAAREAGAGPRWDARIVSAASWFFVVAAAALAARPDAFFSEGNPGRGWRLAGGVALLGLAAAAGWLARRSGARLAGAALVLVGVVPFVVWMPRGALGPAPAEKWIPFVLFPVLIAFWYLFAFRRRRPAAAGGAGTHHPLLALTLAAAAAFVFFPNNFLHGLQRAVVCVDLESGEVLWEAAVLSGPAEQKWDHSSYATPTPATDGERVFAYFGHGLASLDFDGKVQWVKRFPGYAQHTRYGAGGSPILTADSVIVVRESEIHQGGPPSWIGAFDKASGEQLWRIEPPGARDSYTTPLLFPPGGDPQLLTASWEALVAYDPGSGDQLWSHPYPMQQMVASIARQDNLLALTGGTAGEKWMVVVRVHGLGPGTEVEPLWDTKRGVATISSPVLYDGMLFTLTTGGIMTCYEPETGNVLWKQRLEGDYFASLVAADGKIYATNTEGATSVVAAEPEPRLISFNPLEGRVYASPAVSGGSLLIRTAAGLYRIDGGAGEALASGPREPATKPRVGP